MNDRRIIHWHEVESYARSPFAKEKADAVIRSAALGGDEDGFLGRMDDIAEQHQMDPFRLVPASFLEDIIYTMERSREEWHRLMEFANQLRTEEGRAEVERLEALIDSARRDAGIE